MKQDKHNTNRWRDTLYLCKSVFSPHHSKWDGQFDHDEGSDESDGVENIDEGGENLSVEVAGDDGAEGGEDDDDRHADDEVSPGLWLYSSLSHHLTPIKSWNTKCWSLIK